jgi:hypothetical protein
VPKRSAIGVGGGPCGSAGDEYDHLRQFLADPSLGPHDPATAVELAALILIKDESAPTGQAIDTYLPYVRAYNGSGPMANAYAALVLADAHAYQGSDTTLVAGCAAAAYLRQSVRGRGLGAVAKRPRGRLRPAQRGADQGRSAPA